MKRLPHESLARVAIGVVFGALLLLACYSFYLAKTRIYQVDEAQNVFMARVTALGTEQRYFSNGYLILIGPLSWIVGRATTSEHMFAGARVLFFAVYWLNLVLIPFAAGLRLRSRVYWVALLLNAMLCPLLDYGFEVRHDNVMLTLLLSFWCVVRRFRGPAWLGWSLLGAICATLQFVAFKAFLYWLPLSFGILLLPPPALKTRGFTRALSWCGGLVTAVFLVRLAYGSGGAWDAYVSSIRLGLGISGAAARFSPWETLQRLLDQTPVLLAVLAAVALVSTTRSARVGWRSALDWAGSLPEALLCFLATLAFFANPTPFAYNLLHLVPFMVVWLLRTTCVDGAPPLRPALISARWWLALLGLLLIGHVVSFVDSASRHLAFGNQRQVLLMRTAEALTDPVRDPVFDAAGLVPSRQSIGHQWFLHSLFMYRFRNGTLPPLWQQLESHPPAVVFRNYRTDWLGRAEEAFLRKHYLLLADDFLVLGAVLPGGGGTFDCLHAGRYVMRPVEQPGVPTRSDLVVDGRALSAGSVVELAEGPRVVQVAAPSRIQVAWVGPRLNKAPQLPNRSHDRLFVNWY